MKLKLCIASVASLLFAFSANFVKKLTYPFLSPLSDAPDLLPGLLGVIIFYGGFIVAILFFIAFLKSFKRKEFMQGSPLNATDEVRAVGMNSTPLSATAIVSMPSTAHLLPKTNSRRTGIVGRVLFYGITLSLLIAYFSRSSEGYVLILLIPGLIFFGILLALSTMVFRVISRKMEGPIGK